MQGIYKITNLLNNKVYIGSSKYIERRYRNHFLALIKGNHVSPHLQRAFNKYGISSFSFTILEIVENTEDLLSIEQKWIDFYQSSNDTKGYNIRIEAESNRGFKHSEETKNKMSLSRKGHIVSDETRKKIALSNTGKKKSEESKEKMRKAKLGKPSKKRIPILQVSLNGNVIREWDSIEEASKVLKVSRTKIFDCLRDNTKKHFDYTWRYSKELSTR